MISCHDFCTKFTVVHVYPPITRSQENMQQKANIRLCTYPLLTLVQSFSPTALMPIVLKHFVLQHTLARLSLILHKPRLSRLSALPCYVSPIKLDSPSSLKSSSSLRERWRHKMDQRKSFLFPRQYRNCFSRRMNALLLKN